MNGGIPHHVRANARTGSSPARIICLMTNINSSESVRAAQASDAATNEHVGVYSAAAPGIGILRNLRMVGQRPDVLTAQKVEVSIILQAMLGTPVAAEYLADNEVDLSVSVRVLTQPALRRGRHDVNGIPC